MRKALFMAPKMYYYETIRGVQVLKVKGVSKRSIKDYTYEDLLSVMLNRTKFKVSNVVQFNSVKTSLGRMMGIMIKRDLVKTYDIFKRPKRE